ncbi:sulfotransferase [Patescibacteria group bacterium]|nr:sulfotransferase [Patescibacteria group bacterium]
MKHCFILGITTRSGTNYLYNLLNLHPQTLGRGLLSEDFLLHFSKSLQNYKDQLYDLYRQHPTWDVENNICTKKEFLGFLGRGLLDYLESPYIKNGVVKVGSAATDPRLLITKTPSVRGLKRFFKLFPKAKLIILVRDGRSVTESGVKSFSHSYESLMQRWVQAANTIIEFQ